MKKLIITFLFFMITMPAALSFGYGKWTYPTKIKTYIPPNHSRSVMMKHAFQEWSRKTNNKVIFVFSQNKSNAQIEVKFVSKIPNADREIGLTKITTTMGKKIIYADIYIADYTSNGKKLSNDNVYTVMLHEIGHAIGLPHSGDILSIMYPFEDDRQEIINKDLMMLYNIYSW